MIHDLKDKQVQVKVGEFLEELERETGVSQRFLEEARPAVERMFTEIDADSLDEVLKIFRQTALCQAETETSVNNSLEILEQQESQDREAKELEEAIHRMQSDRDKADSSELLSLGWGDQFAVEA